MRNAACHLHRARVFFSFCFVFRPCFEWKNNLSIVCCFFCPLSSPSSSCRADRFDASCEIGALQERRRRRRRSDRRRSESGTTAHDEPSEFESFEPSSQSRALSASPSSCGHDECISTQCRNQRRNAIEFKKPNEQRLWRTASSIKAEDLESGRHSRLQNTTTNIATRCLDADKSVPIGTGSSGGGGSSSAYDTFTSGHTQSTSAWNRCNDDDERWRRRQWPSTAEPYRRHEYDWRQYEWVRNALLQIIQPRLEITPFEGLQPFFFNPI